MFDLEEEGKCEAFKESFRLYAAERRIGAIQKGGRNYESMYLFILYGVSADNSLDG